LDIGTLTFTWDLGLPKKVTLMQIGYLADHQEFIPTLAHWHHREWAYLRPGDSFEARMARLRGCCGHHEIPTVIIASTGGTLLGSAMLIAHDMDTRMELSPWLAGVFVAPERRCLGIGAALVQRVMDEATALGVRRFTFTLQAQSSFTHASAGCSLNVQGTGEQMWQ